MDIVDKQSAGIIADELGGAIIGCYSLVEELTAYSGRYPFTNSGGV